jgi:hypothetical protein
MKYWKQKIIRCGSCLKGICDTIGAGKTHLQNGSKIMKRDHRQINKPKKKVCMYVYLSLYIHIEIYINTFEL